MKAELTQQDIVLIHAMVNQWNGYLDRNINLQKRYDGKIPVKDIGVSVPPPLVNKLKNVSLMWAHMAVSKRADLSQIEGYEFAGKTPAGFDEVMNANFLIDKYDAAVASQMTQGLMFVTATAGDKNEPAVIQSTYDALHAVALIDFRTNSTYCGLTIVDVDPTDNNKITAANYYRHDGSIFEFELINKKWVVNYIPSFTGRCCMEVFRNEPDLAHPFGKSVITPAIESLEDEANRELVRMILHAELYTSPTRWIMGADDKIFDNGRWEAYLGSIFALPPIDDGKEYKLPQTGQYQQGSMEPHIAYIRQLANQFAAASSIPIHSLLYTEANPASAEAIEASKSDLAERVRRLNRLNAASLKNVALLTLSILKKTPVNELSELDRSFCAYFREPSRPSIGATADAACKIAAAVPGFAGTDEFWRMIGYNDRQIADINSQINTITMKDVIFDD